MSYHPETYWNEVAQRVASRGKGNIIAGDDEPYYRYKRKKFLELLHAIPFTGKTVLELGPGPGGNLLEIWKHNPRELCGADISGEMITLARRNLPAEIMLYRIEDDVLSFGADHFDIVLTSTVLQHTTDAAMLEKTIAEMCRVGRSDIYIFERIEKKIKGDELCLGRPAGFYAELFLEHGFKLVRTEFLRVQASYLVSGAIRKIFSRKSRREGEKNSSLALLLQKISLPFTSVLDRLTRADRDLAMLHFQKNKE
ncbi:MAG TPA: class I SAM-dependent methyltransferase [Flavisolibacter sp.]|jgi:ubiquinone/menaquinone biosynthesis C-methylase UbiE